MHDGPQPEPRTGRARRWLLRAACVAGAALVRRRSRARELAPV